TSLFVYCSQNFSTGSSKTRRKPPLLTKNTGTSFSTNSNVPWKNSAEVTAFVRTHKYPSITHIDEKYTSPHISTLLTRISYTFFVYFLAILSAIGSNCFFAANKLAGNFSS